MRLVLKRLHLISFGKFQDYVLNLEDGLNLITGPNEAGKSTIGAFIEGVFYGFRVPGTTRKRYTEDLERYRPWGHSTYRGAVTFSYNGRSLLLQRDFDSEEYHIYDEETGDDIGSDLPGYSNSNGAFPGEYFFGMNAHVFHNTVYIRQRHSRLETDKLEDLQDLILNINTSGDTVFSVRKTIKRLEDGKQEIGTARARKKEYGILSEKKERLISELRNLKRKSQENRQALIALARVEEDLLKEETLREARRKRERWDECRRAAKAYARIQDLEREVEELSRKRGDVEAQWQEQNEHLRRIRDLQNGIQSATNRIDHLDAFLESVEKQIDPRRVEAADKFLAHYEDKSEDFSLRDGVFFLLAGVLVALGFFVRSNDAKVSMALFVLGGVILAIGLWAQSRRRDKKRRILMLREETGIDTEAEAQDILRRAEREEWEASTAREYLQEKNHLVQQIASKDQERRDLLAGCRDEEEYREKMHSPRDLEAQITAAKERLAFLSEEFAWEDFTPEELEADYGNETELPAEFESAVFDREKLLEERSRLRERQKGLGEEIAIGIEKKEQLYSVEEALEKLDRKKLALDTAIQGIREAAVAIRESFVRSVNRATREAVSRITDDVYDDIVIGEDWTIRIYSEETGKMAELDSLSNGTIDQMNFALRYALAKELRGAKTPIFLDDAFVYSDDERVERILRWIAEGDGQKILWSCHRREAQILNENGLDYHHIKLAREEI